MTKKLELNISIDVDAITKAVKASKTLEDNELIFAKLSAIAFDKAQVAAFTDAFEKIEREVKQIINDKAKVLYGPEWTAVKGTGYKISRSLTGSVYEISGEPKSEFLDIKIAPKTKAIDNFIKAKSTLPDGIAYNPNRSDSIRITVKPQDDSQA